MLNSLVSTVSFRRLAANLAWCAQVSRSSLARRVERFSLATVFSEGDCFASKRAPETSENLTFAHSGEKDALWGC